MNSKEENTKENLTCESQYGVTLEEKASFLTRGTGGKWAERDGGPRTSQDH